MSARITAIRMPRYGMTMTEGAVSGWLAEPGDAVAVGQDLLEVETTKITNVETAAAAGTLRRRVVERGGVVPVGALVGVIADPEVPEAEIDAFVAAHAAAPVAENGEAAGGPVESLVDLGAATIAIRRTPAASGADAAPVVLVHGFGGDGDNWLLVEPALADDRPVITLDLPGHGRSGTVCGDGSIATLAQVLLNLLVALGIPKVHLAGHSLGGAIALAAAATAPERVLSLSLVAPAGLGPGIDDGYIAGFLAADRRKELKDVLGRLFADPDAVERRMIDGVLRMKRQDGVPEALSAIAAANFPGGRQAIDLRPALAALALPVAVIWGDQDGIVDPANADGLPEAVAVSRLAGVGHMPQLERPAEVVRLVKAAIAAGGG
ncbi:acetoin dehydrogenase dihydrolipoyllysine-residue acetyltransferase subunit [Methylobrevis albus]|uniref:Acetoin dehydrogenase dihydrolipoyllysine-residue acetyltransferase subunit n=1 Tax=Methylobrevis albus TaxID=2793297 RepID=A0A931I4K8_9HYPH|nr:acetoin dehydrogenase dihydrolipoyllysine-residue acetyltransferase subunit [Methylobrevis albus]MBH0239105.1 acetoin dehydrogenase dihydrolipoyllysine-residue acetyltransferase subunit [Methylobrevis albus]